jgi:hypothetical protein
MRKLAITFFAIALLALFLCAPTGCATVRYARLLPLTTNERARLTCEELDAEIADAEKFKAGLGWRKENGGAQVLGVLGDLGIGNAMEAEAARESADARIESCRAVKREKNCPVTAEEAAALAARQADPAFAFARWHVRGEQYGVYHDNHACTVGERIELSQRAEGTGGLLMCRECKRLDSQE